MRNLVGQPFYSKKPSNSLILSELLSAMAEFSGTCWAPVGKVENGVITSYQLMLNQCPGACGHVWKLNIKNENVVNWLVNEINQKRHS